MLSLKIEQNIVCEMKVLFTIGYLQYTIGLQLHLLKRYIDKVTESGFQAITVSGDCMKNYKGMYRVQRQAYFCKSLSEDVGLRSIVWTGRISGLVDQPKKIFNLFYLHHVSNKLYIYI